MSAGPKYEYLWADGVKIKKAINVSAPEYVDYLMNWVSRYLDDETVFPSSGETPFPKNFQSIVKSIFRRLFRVYAHVYHSHFDAVVALQAEAHLNTSFRHFVYFVHEFQLVDKKELVPMQDVIEGFLSIGGEENFSLVE
jgi:MOB kinase activator 1